MLPESTSLQPYSPRDIDHKVDSVNFKDIRTDTEMWDYLLAKFDEPDLDLVDLINDLRVAVNKFSAEFFTLANKKQALAEFLMLVKNFQRDHYLHSSESWGFFYFYFAKLLQMDDADATLKGWQQIFNDLFLVISVQEGIELTDLITIEESFSRLVFAGTMDELIIEENPDESMKLDEITKKIFFGIVESCPNPNLNYRLIIHFIKSQQNGLLTLDIQEIRLVAKIFASQEIELTELMFFMDMFLKLYSQKGLKQETVEVLQTAVLQKVLSSKEDSFNQVCDCIVHLATDIPGFDYKSFWKKNISLFEALLQQKYNNRKISTRNCFQYFEGLLSRPLGRDSDTSLMRVMELCLFIYHEGQQKPIVRNNLIHFLLQFAKNDIDELDFESLTQGMKQLSPLIDLEEEISVSTKVMMLDFSISYIIEETNRAYQTRTNQQHLITFFREKFHITSDWKAIVATNAKDILGHPVLKRLIEKIQICLELVKGQEDGDFHSALYREASWNCRTSSEFLFCWSKAFDLKSPNAKIALTAQQTRTVAELINSDAFTFSDSIGFIKNLIDQSIMDEKTLETILTAFVMSMCNLLVIKHSEFCECLKLIGREGLNFDRQIMRDYFVSALTFLRVGDFLLDGFSCVSTDPNKEIQTYFNTMWVEFEKVQSVLNIKPEQYKEELSLAYLRAVSVEMGNLQQSIRRINTIYTKKIKSQLQDNENKKELSLGVRFLKNFKRLTFKDYKLKLLLFASHLQTLITKDHILKQQANLLINHFAQVKIIPTIDPEPCLILDENRIWKIDTL